MLSEVERKALAEVKAVWETERLAETLAKLAPPPAKSGPRPPRRRP